MLECQFLPEKNVCIIQVSENVFKSGDACEKILDFIAEQNINEQTKIILFQKDIIRFRSRDIQKLHELRNKFPDRFVAVLPELNAMGRDLVARVEIKVTETVRQAFTNFKLLCPEEISKEYKIN